jgi:peptidoglycan/xylan/chitin deacetylase (PgdA/CDA1 family)
MSRPPATVNVDVDPVDLHLVGYGHRHLPPDPLVYSRALPRIADLLAKTGVRATFFVVGRDAAAQAPALRALIEAGHEVASHSHSHAMALSRLSDEALREETAGSREALSRASGSEVVGFRAPNFDVDARVLRALRDGGYTYDASGYPTPWLIPARIVLALKSGDPLSVLRLRASPLNLKRRPHALGGLTEFPLAVTGAFRFPLYHTLRYWLSRDVFLRHLDHFARAGMPLSYALHAVDALGLAEDSVDPRLGRHPGMRKPLDEKLALLEATFADIAARFACVPFGERPEGLGGPPARARP